MILDYEGMLKQFHTKYGHYMSYELNHPPDDVIVLREKLITEEAQEFYDASYRFHTDERPTPDLVEIADALADILYVTFGAALAYGIPIAEVFEEVHRSNMTKSMLKDEKSIKGKTIKGPNWEPPRIKEILESHGVYERD